MKRLLFLLLFLLFSASAAIAGGSEEAHIAYAVVNNPDPADRLNLRTQPSTSAISLGKFYNGTPVSVFGLQGDWAYVELYKDFRGWMRTEYLAFGSNAQTVSSAMPIVTVTAPAGKTVHETMRANPSVSVPFMMGSRLEVMGVMEDWLFVRWGEEVAGFTKNSGTLPHLYFSEPKTTPSAQLSLLPTPTPSPIPFFYTNRTGEDAPDMSAGE